MAKITVKLVGEGSIDNAAIFFDDPQEKLPHYLNPENDTEWGIKDVNVPMADGDEISYSLYVVAFSGTSFECTLTNEADQKTIKFSDTTGKIIKNRAITKGNDRFK